jgi:hypothetical protein
LLLGVLALVVLDRVLFAGHYFRQVEQELGLDISAIRRH